MDQPAAPHGNAGEPQLGEEASGRYLDFPCGVLDSVDRQPLVVRPHPGEPGPLREHQQKLRQRWPVGPGPLASAFAGTAGARNPLRLGLVAKHREEATGGFSRRPVPPGSVLAALGTSAMEDASTAMRELSAPQDLPVVGAMTLATGRDDRAPAVLATAVAAEPTIARTGPFHHLEHQHLELFALGAGRYRPHGALHLRREGLRHRQVAFVDEIERHYRALSPCCDPRSKIRPLLIATTVTSSAPVRGGG